MAERRQLFARKPSRTFFLILLSVGAKFKALAKLAYIAWQALLFVSELLAMDKKVTPGLKWKQQCSASNVGQFRQALHFIS